MRAGHVLGHEPPHAAEPLASPLGGHVRGLTPDRAPAAHVLFGHAPLRARPLDPLQVDAELLGKPSDERRGPDATFRPDRQ